MGLSIGSEIAGGAQNIHAERISFKGTDQGIRIKANRDRGWDVSGISFKDIMMDGVRTSILISEYYPQALPAGEVESAPLSRLTPFFHDITIENVTSVNSAWAGVIIGLPESPVKNVILKYISIQANRGMQIAYATVTGTNVNVTSAEGTSVTVVPTRMWICSSRPAYTVECYRLPKMAVPTRTQVLPSSIATAKSFDIPMESWTSVG